MKPNQEPEKDRALDKVLGQWTVEASLPPRFQELVWRRIAQAEARPAPGFWAALTRVMEVVLPQPKFAYSYVAALLILGVAAGSWAAQKQNNRVESSLGTRYLQSIDPYQPASPGR